MCLLTQATMSPKGFDDVQKQNELTVPVLIGTDSAGTVVATHASQFNAFEEFWL